MATFDLTEYLEDDAVVLEGIRSERHPEGKAYRFESPSAKIGLWLQHLLEFGIKVSLIGKAAAAGEDIDAAAIPDPGKLVLDDDEERDLYRKVMGPTYDELLDDGVSHGRIQRVFQLLLMHWGANRDIGSQIAAGLPEAPGPVNRAEKRARQRKAGSSSSRASTATPARSRARTSTRSSGTSASGQAAATA